MQQQIDSGRVRPQDAEKDIRREMFCYSVSEHRRRFFLIFTGELFCREPFSFCAVMDSGMRSVNRELFMQLNPSDRMRKTKNGLYI